MLNAIFRPVEQWPGKQTPSYQRQNARFRASYATTLDDLERELNRISAKDIVIQCFLERRDIRNDGWPRSSARPSQPGVIVTFTQDRDAISMPCDTFKDWEQNLRAIALTLHALRMVGQYGVTKHNEQYQGFKRLSAGASTDSWSVAMQFIARHAGVRTEDVLSDLDGAYRIAARRLHPDHGGTHDIFVQLQNHYRTLKSVSPGGVQ